MRSNFLITILIICLSTLITACEETEFSTGSVLEKIENGDLSVEEIEAVEASEEQVEEMEEVMSEVMDPEVKESVEEVMSPDKRNSIDRVKMYLCAKKPPIKKVIIKESDSCYLRDSYGGYVRDKFGGKIRVGYCGTYKEEVIVENPDNKIDKFMVCHAEKGMQNNGRSLCLPRAELEDYINNARAEGGTSYMGPCK